MSSNPNDLTTPVAAMAATATTTSPFLKPDRFDPEDYPRIYVASRARKWVAGVIGLLLVGSTLFTAAMVFLSADARTLSTELTVAIIFLCVLSASIAVVLGTFRRRLTLAPDYIEYKSLFATRSLRRDQIKQWNMQTVKSTQIMEVFPLTPEFKKIKFSLTFTPDLAFYSWFAALPNLAQQEREEAEEQFRNDPALGVTPEARMQKVLRARKLAGWGRMILIGMTVWSYLFPYPYLMFVMAWLVFPWVAIITAWRSKNFYRIDSPGKTTAYPDISLLVILPGIFLGVRATLDVAMIDWTKALVPGIATGVLMMVIVIKVVPGLTKKTAMALLYLLVLSTYGVSGVILTNAMFDHAKPAVYPVKILDLHQTHGRHVAFYFTVPSWGARGETNDVVVSRALYQSQSRGDFVCIQQYAGRFHMPFYGVQVCEPSQLPGQPTQTSAVTPVANVNVNANVSTVDAAADASPKKDKNELAELLRTHQYDVLQTRLDGLQQAYKKGAIEDIELVTTYRDFYDTDPGLRLRYAEWLAAYPNSYPAHLAEAIYYQHLAREARGDGYINTVSDKKIAEMDRYNDIANADLDTSLTLDDRPILSYVTLIDISRHHGGGHGNVSGITHVIDAGLGALFHRSAKPGAANSEATAESAVENASANAASGESGASIGVPVHASATLSQRQLIDAANRVDPGNYIGRRKYMSALETRWGHSTEEMRAFLDESRHSSLSSAKQDALQALVLKDQGWNQENAGDSTAALQSYDQALALTTDHKELMESGIFEEILVTAGHMYEEKQQYAVAKSYFEKAVVLVPRSAKTWSNLGVCQHNLKEYQDAAVSYRKAADLGDALSQNELGKFLWWGHFVPQDRVAALHYLELAAAGGAEGAQQNLDVARRELRAGNPAGAEAAH